MTFLAKSKLPRLAREWYQGRAVVFWTHAMEHRATGWLDDRFHARFREVLLHACARFGVACPAYVLMPDHWHLVWMGLSESSDQTLASAFIRRHLASELAPAVLQDRAHDRVLREQNRKRNSFVTACSYVRENPVRAGLVSESKVWKFSGAMVCGYPKMDPTDGSFWNDFWKIYGRLTAVGDDHEGHRDEKGRCAVPALPGR